MKTFVYAFLLLFGTLFLIFPVAIPVIKSSAEMSIFNTNWNGLSEFAKLCREGRDVVPIFYPYNSVKIKELRGTLLVVAPSIDFSDSEVEEIRKFLEKGGTLFIADDSGITNSLLEKLGIRARFSGKIKDVFYEKNEKFPIIVRIDGDLAKNVEKLNLNVPSAIIGVEGEVKTSKVAFLKEIGLYTILAEVEYGNGRIVLFSDPSALMNEMLPENKQFVINLIDLLGSGTFYFDEAHRTDLNPYSTATVYIHRDLKREHAFGLIIAVATFAVLSESGTIYKTVEFFKMVIFRRIFRGEKKILKDLPEWVEKDKMEEILKRMGYDRGAKKRSG